MIADVLHDAVHEIDEYRAQATRGVQPYADWYGGEASERIRGVRDAMDALRRRFDSEDATVCPTCHERNISPVAHLAFGRSPGANSRFLTAPARDFLSGASAGGSDGSPVAET